MNKNQIIRKGNSKKLTRVGGGGGGEEGKW